MDRFETVDFTSFDEHIDTVPRDGRGLVTRGPLAGPMGPVATRSETPFADRFETDENALRVTTDA